MTKFGNGSSVSLEERYFLGRWATLIFCRRLLLRGCFNRLRNCAKHINLSAWCFFPAAFVSSSFVCNPIYKYGYWLYEHFIELRKRNLARCYTILTINCSVWMWEDWQSELKLAREKRPTTMWLLRWISVRGPGSSVGIVTDYGLDGPGSNPGGDEIFRASRPALGPTQPAVQWVPRLSRG